jgi:predicted peptidase
LAQLPTWVFHGALDQVVPVETSQRMVRALEAQHAPVKLTVYDDLAHPCWERAYREPELYEWLLGQRRAGSARTSG